MRSSRRSVRKNSRTGRTIAVFSVVLVLAGFLVAAYLWSSANSGSEGFRVFRDHYLGIMSNLDSGETKSSMVSRIEGEYNFTGLFGWEHSMLSFNEDSAGWFEDPIVILNEGKGICAQFSIVYVSACLALGHQARLVVAANTADWSFIHVWAEVYSNGSWVHVDPSDQVVNQPLRYKNWDWGSHIGSDVRIYAFEDGKVTDVTSNYS
jgi:hypothetical protein